MWSLTGYIQSNGLLVDVQVGVSSPRQEALYRAGIAVPPAVHATFIIDTGADSTMVDSSLMLALGLQPTGQTHVLSSTAGGVPVPCDVFDISLELPNPKGVPWRLPSVEALGRALPNQSTQGMLGRDILKGAILHIDGPRGTFSLNYYAHGSRPSGQ